MTNNLSISEQLTHSTVCIECELPNGEIATGTGFFYAFLKDEEKDIPVIVTNKHVVEGAKHGKIYINIADSTGKLIVGKHESVIFDNFEKRWIPHPENEVDLCIMPIGELLHVVESKGKKPFFISIDNKLIPTNQELSNLTAIDISEN